MSLIEISNSSAPIDICYSDNSIINGLTETQALKINGLSNGYLKTTTGNVMSVATIPITDITGFSGAIVTNPLSGNLDANGLDIYDVNQLETNTISLNGQDLNARLTTDENNINNNTSAINTKFTKSGDTFTGPVSFGVGSSIDFNGQTLQNVFNITHQGPGRITFFNCGLIPAVTNTRTLGEPLNQWSNVYATDLSLNGTSVSTSLSNKLDITGGTMLGNINLNSNNLNNVLSASGNGVNDLTISNNTNIILSTGSSTFDCVTLNNVIKKKRFVVYDGFGISSSRFMGFGLINSAQMSYHSPQNHNFFIGTDEGVDVEILRIGTTRALFNDIPLDSTTLLTLGSTVPCLMSSKSFAYLIQSSQTYAVTASTWRLANNVASSRFAQGFTSVPGQFRAQYTGTRSRAFNIDLNVSCSSSIPNTSITIMTSVNGNLVPGSLNRSQTFLTTATTVYNVVLNDMLTLNTSDTIQIAILSNITGNITFTFSSIRISSEIN